MERNLINNTGAMAHVIKEAQDSALNMPWPSSEPVLSNYGDEDYSDDDFEEDHAETEAARDEELRRAKKHAIISESKILSETSKKLMLANSPSKLAAKKGGFRGANPSSSRPNSGASSRHGKRVKLRTKESRLHDLISQSHKIIRDIETEKRELLKVQHLVMDGDQRLEELRKIFGGYKTHGSSINSGEPPNADKREDEGFLVRVIQALESRLHKSKVQLGTKSAAAATLKGEINEKRFIKQNAKVLAMSWVATVQDKQDALSTANHKLSRVKGEINALQHDIEELKQMEHHEAVENNRKLRKLARERIKHRAAHRQMLVAPKQVNASVRRQKALGHMVGRKKHKRKGGKDDTDTASEVEPTEEELRAFEKEEEEKAALAEKVKRDGMSLRYLTGSIEKFNSSGRPATAGVPFRPSGSRNTSRPSTSGGPSGRAKKAKWHPGKDNGAISRLDGRPVPAGRRGSLVGRAPGRTVHGKISGKVELMLARVPDAEAIKKKNMRKQLVTKWKLARVGAKTETLMSDFGYEELNNAFNRILEERKKAEKKESDDGGVSETATDNTPYDMDDFVRDFVSMEHRQLSYIRRMEHCEQQMLDLQTEKDMLIQEQNALEGKVGASKKQTQAGKQARMEKLNEQELAAKELTIKFKEDIDANAKLLGPIFSALGAIMKLLDRSVTQDILQRKNKFVNNLLRTEGISESNVEKVLGEMECNIDEITAIVTRWELANEAKQQSIRDRSGFSSATRNRQLVGNVRDQMREKEQKGSTLYNAVKNRNKINENLEEGSESEDEESDEGGKAATAEKEKIKKTVKATNSKSIRPRSKRRLVVLPKQEEILAEDIDSDEETPLHRSQLFEKAEELYEHRKSVERFFQRQKQGTNNANRHKRLQLDSVENYGSTKGMRFTRRRAQPVSLN
jgi:hypothetical protein